MAKRKKVRRKVCEKCRPDRKRFPRIGRPCPECGSHCGCGWHYERRRKL